MQHTYRVSKAVPMLSYLPRFINSLQRISEDLQICQNIKTSPINYLPLHPLLLTTLKNRICVLVMSHIEFHLNPTCTFVFSNRNREHTHFFKNLFFELLELQNVKIR